MAGATHRTHRIVTHTHTHPHTHIYGNGFYNRRRVDHRWTILLMIGSVQLDLCMLISGRITHTFVINSVHQVHVPSMNLVRISCFHISHSICSTPFLKHVLRYMSQFFAHIVLFFVFFYLVSSHILWTRAQLNSRTLSPNLDLSPV